MTNIQCVKRIQIRSFFWSVFSPNTGKYGPGKTPYLDTFHALIENASVIAQVGKIHSHRHFKFWNSFKMKIYKTFQ